MPIKSSRYGQMTAGSYCYIGPQGIVHGTYVCISFCDFVPLYFINNLSNLTSKKLTILNIFRKYYGDDADLSGRVFLSSGLGLL